MSSSHRKCPIILNAVCEVDIGCVISTILMLVALDDSLHQITPGCRHTPSTKHWTQCGRRWASCIQHLGILHSLCSNGSSSAAHHNILHYLAVRANCNTVPMFQVFILPVPDVHSSLFVSVFDEDKNHKTEFLGMFSKFELDFSNAICNICYALHFPNHF